MPSVSTTPRILPRLDLLGIESNKALAEYSVRTMPNCDCLYRLWFLIPLDWRSNLVQVVYQHIEDARTLFRMWSDRSLVYLCHGPQTPGGSATAAFAG